MRRSTSMVVAKSAGVDALMYLVMDLQIAVPGAQPAGLAGLGQSHDAGFLGHPATGHEVVEDAVEVDAQAVVRLEALGQGGAVPCRRLSGLVVQRPPVRLGQPLHRDLAAQRAHRPPVGLAAPGSDGLGSEHLL
ncbi:hypothetical protein [Streptomyces sp. NBC_01304]|uniref:hypothetical protein n=1 Tax=Streptomyces sp. NBC_01304 TaxID=2903818 RepID=UPI002E1640D4|nr:hypothetical protein OG430_06495 [Streptomyces sp. NBC_01304]